MRVMTIDVPTDAATLLPHGASLGALGAALTGFLPWFVTLIPMVYYLLLIYEGKTVQGILKRRTARRRAIRVAKLLAAKKVADAKVEASALVTATAAKLAVDEAKS